MTQNQVAGLLGSALMFAGLFSPIFDSEVKGDFNYFQYNSTHAGIVLFLAAVSLTLSVVRRYHLLLFVGLAALGVMAFTFIEFQVYTSGEGAAWLRRFSDSEFEGINRLMRQTFSLDWGWGLLLVGAVLVTAAGNLKGYGTPGQPS